MSIHLRDLGEAVLDLLYWRPTEQAPELSHDRHLLIREHPSGQASEAAWQGRPNVDPELACDWQSNSMH